MGSKTKVHQRQLTPEERALIAMQHKYLQSMQPAVDLLVDKGTSLLNDVYNPDWMALQQYTLGEIEKIRGEQAALARGELPQQYLDSKKGYYRDIYENAMGNQLAGLAQRGVINSSRFSSAHNQYQKNLMTQMSKDFTNDMEQQRGLLQQRWNMAQAPYKLAEATHLNTLKAPLAYLHAARGQGGDIANALQAQGSMNNGRTYATQKSGPLSAVASIAGAVAPFF